jgi:hypothetical protein
MDASLDEPKKKKKRASDSMEDLSSFTTPNPPNTKSMSLSFSSSTPGIRNQNQITTSNELKYAKPTAHGFSPPLSLLPFLSSLLSL